MRFAAIVAAIVLTLGLAYSGAAPRSGADTDSVAGRAVNPPNHRVAPAHAPAGVEVLMRHGW